MNEVQKTILDCSTALFAKYGFDRVTVRKIAESAGITVPAIYHYYADKNALYTEVVDLAWEIVSKNMIDALRDTSIPLKTRITNFLLSNTRAGSKISYELKIILREQLDAADVEHYISRLDKHSQPLFKTTGEVFRGVANGLNRNRLSQFLICVYYGIVATRGAWRELQPWKSSDAPYEAIATDMASYVAALLEMEISGAPMPSADLRTVEPHSDGRAVALAKENERLKTLLTEAMLANLELRERLGAVEPAVGEHDERRRLRGNDSN